MVMLISQPVETPAGDPSKVTKKVIPQATPQVNSTRSLNVGRPGSKRYQRFLNRAFLIGNGVQLLPEDLNVFVAKYSPLSSLFEPENRKIWEEFVTLSEEKQELFLASLNPQIQCSQNQKVKEVTQKPGIDQYFKRHSDPK